MTIRVIWMIVCFISIFFSVAGFADDFRHHVIILIDRSGSMDGGEKDDNEKRIRGFNQLVTSDLEEICFSKGHLIENRKLLEQQDYLTILTFGLSESNPDFKNFILPLSFDGIMNSNKKFIYSTSFNEGMFARNNIILKAKKQYDEFFSMLWTALSVSVPLAINYCNINNTRYKQIKVHKTYVILITDEDYNDYKATGDEIGSIRENAETKYHTILRNELFAINRSKNVRKKFSWGSPSIDMKRGGTLPKDSIKLKLFQIEPNTGSFTLAHILKYNNTHFLLNRVLKGYRSYFEIFPKPDPEYVVTKLKIDLIDNKGHIFQNNSRQLFNVTQNETIDFFIPEQYKDISLKVKLACWVHWKDNAYGAHELHPYGTKEQGADGLTDTIPVSVEKTLTILWDIPLSNKLYNLGATIVGNNQRDVQSLYNISAVVVGTVVLISFIFIVTYALFKLIRHSVVTENNFNESDIVFS